MKKRNLSQYQTSKRVLIGFFVLMSVWFSAAYAATTANSAQLKSAPDLPFTLATSYISPWEDLSAISNQIIPTDSGDRTGGAYGNWRRLGGYGQTHWVSYSWDSPQVLGAFEVYWWSDGAGVVVPTIAIVEYLKDNAWVKLGNIGLELDQFNRLDFPAVSTSSIRVSMSSNLSTGILEARVFESNDVPAPFPTLQVDKPVNVAPTATLATSYISPWRRLSAMTNGSTHRNSADRTGGAYGNWRGINGFGRTDAVIFSWDTAQVLTSVEVYWWNNPNAQILVPNTAKVQYWTGTVWTTLGNIGVELDQYNRLDFNQISTTGIRISMSSDQATGILEARIYADKNFQINPPLSYDDLVNVATSASLGTSYVSPWRRLSEMTNGSKHSSSMDRTGGAYGNWRGPEGFWQTEWVSFSWDSEQILDSVEVYWWNNSDAQVIIPSSTLVEYWDGSGWVSLGRIGVDADRYNRLDLGSISTTSVRISMSSMYSTGILEARVWSGVESM